MGTQTGMPIPISVNRTYAAIGENQWTDPHPMAYFDELKIFNIALTQAQIQAHMNENMSYVTQIN